MGAAGLSAPAPAWLWPEADGVRWWTPAGTAFWRLGRPEREGAAPAVGELRDAGRRQALDRALQDPLGPVLAETLREHGRVILNLTADLPSPWHACPFEWLQLDGHPIHGRLLVARHHPRRATPAPPAATRETVVCDLWPGEEAFAPLVEALRAAVQGPPVLRGRAEVEGFLAHSGAASWAAWVVVAHGTEKGQVAPFALPDAGTWALPTAAGLPPLVVVLACGDDVGNLMEYGRSLLAAGARTVIAPLGRPDAGALVGFVQAFFRHWDTGAAAAEALLAAQGADPAGRGARRLQLLGHGGLRVSEAPEARELADRVLAERARTWDATSLAALVERITLDSYQRDGSPAGAVFDLYQRLGLEYENPTEGPELFRALERVVDHLAPLSAAWVLPFLVYLAERYDHARMDRYRRAVDRMALGGQAALPATPLFFHYLARAPYRNGDYVQGIGLVAEGLAALTPTDAGQEAEIKLLGNLANHLIDLALPEEAEQVLVRIDRCLSGYQGPAADTDRFTLLDRRARLALRQGGADGEGLVAAHALYRQKRAEAVARGWDGHRELAWLLYVAAWGRLPEGRGYAKETAALLADVESGLRHIALRNLDPLYLLRALALAAWRFADPEAEALVARYLERMDDLALRNDSGPLGFAVGFLYLMGGDRWRRQWVAAEQYLGTDRYWLELAALSHLMGKPDEAASYLGRFQDQRRDALERLRDTLLPHGPAAFTAPLMSSLCQLPDRQRREREALNTGTHPESLLVTGLLPL